MTWSLGIFLALRHPGVSISSWKTNSILLRRSNLQPQTLTAPTSPPGSRHSQHGKGCLYVDSGRQRTPRKENLMLTAFPTGFWKCHSLCSTLELKHTGRKWNVVSSRQHFLSTYCVAAPVRARSRFTSYHSHSLIQESRSEPLKRQASPNQCNCL